MGIYTYEDMKQGLLKETFLYFKLLSKVFAAPIAYIAYRLGITANQVTILGILLSIPAAYLNFTGNFIWAIAVFHLFFLLDAADGVLARGTNSKSILGAYLDDLAHYSFQPVFLVTFALGLYKEGFTGLAFASALFALLNTLYRANLDLINKLKYKNGIVGSGESGESKDTGTLIYAIKGLILRSFDFPNILVWITLLFWNKPLLQYYLLYASVCSGLYLIFVIYKTVRDGFAN